METRTAVGLRLVCLPAKSPTRDCTGPLLIGIPLLSEPAFESCYSYSIWRLLQLTAAGRDATPPPGNLPMHHREIHQHSLPSPIAVNRKKHKTIQKLMIPHEWPTTGACNSDWFAKASVVRLEIKRWVRSKLSVLLAALQIPHQKVGFPTNTTHFA